MSKDGKTEPATAGDQPSACGRGETVCPGPVIEGKTVPVAPTSVVVGASAAPLPAPSPAEVFAKVKTDLVACYEEGKKAIATMTSGKVTFQMSVDAAGTPSCVVPSEDQGLTQEVEDCMRARLAREKFGATSTPWTSEIPIVVRDASLSLGTARKAAPTIETVETHGLSEDVYGVVEAMLPEMYECLRGIDKSAGVELIRVGARIGKDGRVECALAASPTPVPLAIRECVAGVVRRAKFRPPKKGVGLLAVPLNVTRKR